MAIEQSSSPILGIEKAIPDPVSGLVLTYHVVANFNVSKQQGGVTSVTFASYPSREAYQLGSPPASHLSVDLQGSPIGDHVEWPTWFAECALDGRALLDFEHPTNPFEGGIAVRAEERV